MHYHCYDVVVASFPGPTQPSITISTEKWGRAWYLFSHEWHEDRKDDRKGLIVCGRTGPRTAKRTKLRDNLPHISSYWVLTVVHTKRWACSWLKTCETQLVSSANFRHILITSCSSAWEKIPGSPCFSILKATESWVRTGNVARVAVLVQKQFWFKTTCGSPG